MHLPAPPGNVHLTRATSSTAGNELLLSASTEVLQEVLLQACPWIIQTDVIAIEQYCRIEARSRLLAAEIDKIIEEKGFLKVPAYLWTVIIQSDQAAMKASAALGLTPESRLKLAKDAGLASQFNRYQLEDLVNEGTNLRKKYGR